MTGPGIPPPIGRALARLRLFAAADPARAEVARCELCAAALPPEHGHVLEQTTGRLRCACSGCVIATIGVAGERLRPVPPRCERLAIALSDAQWHALGVPIGLAFFQRIGGGAEIVAHYPSPAGLARSSVDLETWSALVTAAPVLGALEPDTAALLVRRLRGASDYYIVSIDECFHLAGLVRRGYRGISGGDVWTEVDHFFTRLRARATRVEAHHA